jgi:hypothetical protein
MDMWKLWLYALRNPTFQFFCDKRNVNVTHDMGIILRYRLGKATPARLTCRRVKVSGTLSSFRVAERTSLMRSLVGPTQILNSFMLHGCSEHLSRSGMDSGYLELKRPTFMVLQEELHGAIGGGFLKLGLSTHLSERDAVWAGLSSYSASDESRGSPITLRASSRRSIHCLMLGFSCSPLHLLFGSEGRSTKIFSATKRLLCSEQPAMVYDSCVGCESLFLRAS